MGLPSTSASAAGHYIMNVGAVGLAGTVLGIPFQPLLLAAIAGGLMLGLAPATPNPRNGFALASVIMSALLGGTLAPLVAHYCGGLGWFSADKTPVAESLVAVAVGAGWPWALGKVGPALGDGLGALITRVLGGRQEPKQ